MNDTVLEQTKDPVSYELRNAFYSSSTNEVIDCEFNHPSFGWIPFTAHANDPEPHSRDIYDQLITGNSCPISPYTPPPITYLQDQAWENIKGERVRRMNTGGIKVIIDGVSKWFHSDEASRIQYIGLVNQHIGPVSIGDSIPPDIKWKTMDGSFVNMTSSIAQALISSTVISDQAVFLVAEKHKAEMMKLANPLDYDFSAGWPIAFWER